ncbi:MAG: tRNA (guanine(9)-N(1))-methyltransferase [Ramalina farinacea]|uniref:tRNA (guanine(9)-N1)-methyltransferase n=1 Tax=Ramalina farinacea TaxID=258253 RepID=A0AA43TUW8_9LECA|nr:tRNA (guanine(9)-N(1))-methyltransferase [Ramalina farinacea]
MLVFLRRSSFIFKFLNYLRSDFFAQRALRVDVKTSVAVRMSSQNGEDMAPAPLSKNQQKKLKRDQQWEAGREARKAKRKEKFKAKKAQKRAEQTLRSKSELDGDETIPHAEVAEQQADAITPKPTARQHIRLPITFLLDCGFDDLMTLPEIKSLGSQITRCYSDNHKAPYQAHLSICSFGGRLKERFDGLLAGSHNSWRGVHFLQEGFSDAARKAETWMLDDNGGTLAGAFAGLEGSQAGMETAKAGREVVYLTSDSPNTLTELQPYSTYIIGGFVDRNRHKGISYKRALDENVRTAKLPIGEYMEMTSRAVLATNHVHESMLRWLELGDWGKAFVQVIPKRKGGTARETAQEQGNLESDNQDNGDTTEHE